MKTYGISGLGADERVFEELNSHLDHPTTYIPWIAHHENERLHDYALRLAESIDTSEEFILIGLSFGGMIATEISKMYTAQKTILISSAACRNELPILYRGAGRVGAVSWIPEFMLSPPVSILNMGLQVKDPGHRILMKKIVDDTDKSFLRWAMKSISTWDNQDFPSDLIRIHGDHDRIIPLQVQVDHLVEGGGHLMVLEQSHEVAEILNQIMKA